MSAAMEDAQVKRQHAQNEEVEQYPESDQGIPTETVKETRDLPSRFRNYDD